MKNSVLHEKSIEFAAIIVKFYEKFVQQKVDTTIAKQLLRSATSIGANLNEATYGNSKADFISKMHISLKECPESIYWLELIKRVGYVESTEVVEKYIKLANEIKAMLISSINTAKNKTTSSNEF